MCNLVRHIFRSRQNSSSVRSVHVKFQVPFVLFKFFSSLSACLAFLGKQWQRRLKTKKDFLHYQNLVILFWCTGKNQVFLCYLCMLCHVNALLKKVTFSILSSYRKLFLGLVNYKAL